MSKANRIRFFILWVVMFCCYPVAFAQSSSNFKFSIDVPAQFISVDNLDNIYALTEKNELLKYNSDGKLVWNYSNKAFGRPGVIDVRDPMRILLFYPLLQQVVVLNNNLNEVSRYDFNSNSSRYISLISTANSNGFWIYDQLNRQLIRLSDQFNEEQILGNIFLQTSLKIQPKALLANNQYIFLADPKIGLLQFDRFGSFIRTFPLFSEYIQLFEESVIYQNNSSVNKLELSTGEIKTIDTFSSKPLQVATGNKLRAALYKNQIKIYSSNPKPSHE